MAKDKSTTAAMIETAGAPREIINKRGISPYENPNRIVANKGLRYLQDHVEQDSHYISILDTRLSALLRTGWKIQPGHTMKDGRLVISDDDRVLAEFVKNVLDNLRGSFEADIMAMMTHISRGFSISEINYKYIERGTYSGKLGLESIRFKEQEFYAFEYDTLGHYSLVQTDPERKVLDIRKFVHLINGFNDENPYGMSMAAVCAFWVWLKENGAKYWSIYQERFGQPFAALEIPENISETERRLATEIISGVHESTGMLIPKNMVLKYIEAMRTGEANYRGFLEFSNNEISKAILGSTLTVDTQKNASGSHALGQEHADVMGIKFSYDIITSQAAINQFLIKRLIDYNFADVERYPRFQWNNVNCSEFITFAQGISALMASGVQIPASWVHEVMNIPIAEDGEEVLEPSGVASYPVAGVDNKVMSAGALPQMFTNKKTRMNTNGKDGEPESQKYGNKYEKRAVQQAEVNESLILRGKQQLTGKWEGFAKKIAESGKFDFDTLRKFEENEVAGVLGQFLLIASLRGIESGLVESQAGAYGLTTNITNKRHKWSQMKGQEGQRRGKDWIPDQVRNDRSAALESYSTLGWLETDKFTYYYEPFEKIIKEFKQRKLISKAEFDELTEKMKRLAFTVARADSNRVLGKIQQELELVLLGKDTLPDFYDQVVGLFDDCGVIGVGNHIETVLRTNLQSQYTEGRMEVYADLDREEFPYMCLEIVDDSATREHHRKLSGYTRRADDPVWLWLRPPLEYNCRCTVRAVHVTEEAEESDWMPEKGDFEFTAGV